MNINPVFKFTPRHVKLIDEISSLRERILNSKISVAWKPIMQREAIIRNAMGSTAIEGYVLSLPEVEALSNRKNTDSEFNDNEKAVFNYLAALKYIQKTPKTSLDNEFILKLHSIATKGMLKDEMSGHYRSIQNYVVTGTGQIMYTPPEPGEVKGLIETLIKWVNNESDKYLPVISSGILHFQFVSIHPFIDGNGRVARLLGTWDLLRRKFDTNHIFSIDDIIYEHKNAYYSALIAGQRAGDDMTTWLEYYLEIVAESLDKAWRRIAALPVSNRLKDALSLTPKQEKLLKLFHESGDLSSNEIAKILRVTVQGVHFILQPLIKAKIVARTGGRKTGKFGLIK
jgi:Fic family protein